MSINFLLEWINLLDGRFAVSVATYNEARERIIEDNGCWCVALSTPLGYSLSPYISEGAHFVLSLLPHRPDQYAGYREFVEGKL